MWARRRAAPRATVDPAEQRAALKRKLDEVGALLEEERASTPSSPGAGAPEDCTVLRTSSGQAIATGLSERCVVRFARGADGAAATSSEVLVLIGTSKDAEVPGRVERISDIVNSAYSAVGKRKRMDRYDVMHRLEMGDDGVQANRVLHMAYKGDELVGCASSTFSPGWTDEGCGHWGLLAVDPAHQSGGVATALVLAAERRLATNCEAVQIEYQHTEGEEFSQRLMRWYEDKLGFDGGPRRQQRPGTTTFRHCVKYIPDEEQQRGRQRRLKEFHTWLKKQLIEAGGSPTEGDTDVIAGKPPPAAGKSPSSLSASTASPASAAAKGDDAAMDDSESDSDVSSSSSP